MCVWVCRVPCACGCVSRACLCVLVWVRGGVCVRAWFECGSLSVHTGLRRPMLRVAGPPSLVSQGTSMVPSLARALLFGVGRPCCHLGCLTRLFALPGIFRLRCAKGSIIRFGWPRGFWLGAITWGLVSLGTSIPFVGQSFVVRCGSPLLYLGCFTRYSALPGVCRSSLLLGVHQQIRMISAAPLQPCFL